MRSRGNRPGRHDGTFRGGVIILLRAEPELTRLPRQEYLLVETFRRPRHHVCYRPLDRDVIGEADATLERARGRILTWKVVFRSVSRVILLCGDVVSRKASDYRHDAVDFFGCVGARMVVR